MDKNIVGHLYYHSSVPSRERYVFTTSALLASGLAATIGTAAIGAAAYGASSLMGGGSKSSGSSGSSSFAGLPAMPSAPTGAEATSAEKARIRKKTKTILTSPLTGSEDYGSAAPTLLGSGDTTKKTTLG